MANNEEGEENTNRGNEWEVVSLTASAYAAAPGPEEVELNDNDKANMPAEEAETSHALFMSGHFVFPPSQHENLPLEPNNSTFHKDHGDKDVVNELAVEEAGRSSGKDEENWEFKGLAVPDEFQGIQIFDEKGNRLAFRGTDFEEGRNLQGLHLVEEQNLYSAAARYNSFQSETGLSGSTAFGEETAVPDFIEPLEQGSDAGDITRSPRPSKDDRHDGSRLPCGAWWKRGAASLYSQAKQANAFWSIFIAAAVMGLVILGQQWQQERWQTMQLKWQFRLNSEKTGRMFGPISRLKDVIVGGHRRGSLIRGSSSEN
ncbi:ATG8-interacting protein 1 isoform X2 [Morus notabilis]|nr:ATG8-interacting protein 1 isoform X2 [Morus notabilis]